MYVHVCLFSARHQISVFFTGYIFHEWVSKTWCRMLILWLWVCAMPSIRKQKRNTRSSSNFRGNKFHNVMENREICKIYGPRKISALRYDIIGCAWYNNVACCKLSIWWCVYVVEWELHKVYKNILVQLLYFAHEIFNKVNATPCTLCIHMQWFPTQ